MSTTPVVRAALVTFAVLLTVAMVAAVVYLVVLCGAFYLATPA